MDPVRAFTWTPPGHCKWWYGLFWQAINVRSPGGKAWKRAPVLPLVAASLRKCAFAGKLMEVVLCRYIFLGLEDLVSQGRYDSQMEDWTNFRSQFSFPLHSFNSYLVLGDKRTLRWMITFLTCKTRYMGCMWPTPFVSQDFALMGVNWRSFPLGRTPAHSYLKSISVLGLVVPSRVMACFILSYLSGNIIKVPTQFPVSWARHYAVV